MKTFSRMFSVLFAACSFIAFAVSVYGGAGPAASGDIDSIRKDAEQGLAEAQYYLGLHYEQENNMAEAAQWYRKAADQDDLDAQYKLGVCYENGAGVAKNTAEAVKWYRKAADKGIVEAQFCLGRCYEKGIGVARSIPDAVDWYRKAADRRHVEAQYRLGYCYENYGEVMNSDRAAMWYRRAAEAGYPEAQNAIARCYETGKGVDKNTTEAFHWYGRAAAQNVLEAQLRLARCYENGIGTTKNIETALKWYRKAAAQGDAGAKAMLNELESGSNNRQRPVANDDAAEKKSDKENAPDANDAPGSKKTDKDVSPNIVTTDLDIVDPNDGLISLREAVEFYQMLPEVQLEANQIGVEMGDYDFSISEDGEIVVFYKYIIDIVEIEDEEDDKYEKYEKKREEEMNELKKKLETNPRIQFIRQRQQRIKERGMTYYGKGIPQILFAKDYEIKLSSPLVLSNELIIDGQDHRITVTGPETGPLFRVAQYPCSLKLSNLTLISNYSGDDAGILKYLVPDSVLSRERKREEEPDDYYVEYVTPFIKSRIELISVKDGGTGKSLWQVSNCGVTLDGACRLHRLQASKDTTVTIWSRSVLEDSAITGLPGREGGDFIVFGTLKNSTASGNGDIFVKRAGTGEKLRIGTNGYLECDDDATIDGLTLDDGGVFRYQRHTGLTGKITLSGGFAIWGTTVPKEWSMEDDPITDRKTDIVFDVSMRPPRWYRPNFSPPKGSEKAFPNFDKPQPMLDLFNPFRKANSFTVRAPVPWVNSMEYELANKAKGFTGYMSLELDGKVYRDVLSTKKSATVGDYNYSLVLTPQNTLILRISRVPRY